ncbi:MAG: AAA family ATPase [Alphaproteobacteria bacterium]|nr:AAA family ATPase [Alphaproteobacteria bacterium]MCW5739414.1 AAA family ATPase [Alphaproteobacteria bacterium]
MQELGGRYRLTRRVLPGDTARGIPALWHAHDAGDAYYVKLWKRVGDDRNDIRALWNREVRSLSRLQGYPGAASLFVRLHDIREEEKHFYAVLDSGWRRLLKEVLAERSRIPWLTNLSEVGRRRPLWEGLLRIAEALALLHSEGTLHRTLGTASIFAGPDGEGDFRLSGFEWSLRIAGSDRPSAATGRVRNLVAPELAKAEGEHSTATDWFDFGLVAAELFGVPVSALRNREAVRSATTRLHTLRNNERYTILRLLEESHELRLASSDEVLQEIRNLIRDLSAAPGGHIHSVVLAVSLGSDVSLSRDVELASERTAPVDKPLLQLQWIERDLRGDRRVIARTHPRPHYTIRGDKLEYHVRPWRTSSGENWAIGYCQRVETVPRTTAEDQYYSLGQRRLEIVSRSTAQRTFYTLRDRAAPWDRTFNFVRTRRHLDPHLRNVHDFFRITQQIDTLLTAAQICPVRVTTTKPSAYETIVTVTPIEDPARNQLAQQLRLPPPSEQLKDWFDLGAEAVSADDEDDPTHDVYHLLVRRTVDSEGGAVKWRFRRAISDPSGPLYMFSCPYNVTIGDRVLYLARNHGGTIAQLKRRHKAIDDMRSHESLLRWLADPKGTSRTNSDILPAPRTEIPLDESKIAALSRLWRTQPLFAVQGPPGTGKTTLIRAFADRLFKSDPTAQILISAHSHHTVDDVATKLSKLFSSLLPSDRPLLLRLSADEGEEHALSTITSEIIQRLKQSELAKRVPCSLQSRLANIGSKDKHTEQADVDLRTMQLLIQDSANVTLATLNAPDLAELAERGRRFDWSIIEEAGKAHGFDMAIALEESHRLLLIGDHYQLPPFNSKIFKDLLAEPLRVRSAIQTGTQFASSLIDVSIVDDEEGRESFEDRCDSWRRMVDVFGTLFESSGGNDPGSDGPAQPLTDQHRMHPDIAELVGSVFYRDKASGTTILKSPPETHEHFKKVPPYVISEESWLPRQRIVWCDVPWKQKTEMAEGEMDGLFASPAEAAAVIKVLGEFQPNGDALCEVQVLSPYNDQLDLIDHLLSEARREGRLATMYKPPFDLAFGKRSGATVDEFQGSEADIVVVSLVRNNPLVARKSLGFLREPNRMNVLLSRARHKLIIVGSWDFFASRCDDHTPLDEEYAYIGRMMEFAKSAQEKGTLCRKWAPK